MTSWNQPDEGGEELENYDERRWKPKKHYKYKEDELLDEIEDHEMELNQMLKYLTEVEDLMKG